jgi:hypothetical protein
MSEAGLIDEVRFAVQQGVDDIARLYRRETEKEVVPTAMGVFPKKMAPLSKPFAIRYA